MYFHQPLQLIMAQSRWLIYQESGLERPKSRSPRRQLILKSQIDLWVLNFQRMTEEMLDLLRIVDDGAAGRRGGHLRFTKGLDRAERVEFATYVTASNTLSGLCTW